MNSRKEVVTRAVPPSTRPFWIIVKCVYRYRETILMRTVGFSIYSMSLFMTGYTRIPFDFVTQFLIKVPFIIT